LKAIAIDDEPVALKVIENFCREIAFLSLEKTFEDSRSGLKYLNKFPTDLVFLDIDMPQLNGLELFRSMKQNVMVIFITSRAEYAVQGFEMQAVDYLLKPFTFERFLKAAQRADELFKMSAKNQISDKSDFIYIRADFSLVKVALPEINYIEALDDYIKIHIRDKKTLVARLTMKSMSDMLPPDKFIRVHRSFIVPLQRITALKSKSILLTDSEVPIGASYYADVAAVYKGRQ
jgi:DNA-binding LytR/AlgR family response regulator